MDYLGHEANDKKVIQANEFTLSETGWTKIVNDIICNRLHKEIMRVNAWYNNSFITWYYKLI